MYPENPKQHELHISINLKCSFQLNTYLEFQSLAHELCFGCQIALEPRYLQIWHTDNAHYAMLYIILAS